MRVLEGPVDLRRVEEAIAGVEGGGEAGGASASGAQYAWDKPIAP
ncbi:hypothetical protein HMPREF0307_00437 [Corynebacterium sp. DNF00584]|nr:hypothetical protein HMPREF0307_00437 [Corynebacterium sp. DNF00584]